MVFLQGRLPGLVDGSHHTQHVGGVLGEGGPVSFQLVRQLKEEFPALIVPLKEGLEQEIPLGQIVGVLAGVAVGGRGGDTAGLVHKACHGLVQRHIFSGKVVVIVVIGVKIFQLLLIDGHFQGAVGPFPPEVTAVHIGGDGFGQGRVQLQRHHQFPALAAVDVLVIICLDFPCLHRLVEQIIKSQHGQGVQHPLQIVCVVKEKGVFRELRQIFYIVVVDSNEFSARKHILSLNAKKLLQRFLLAVGQFQKVPVGRHSLVDVQSLESVEAVGKGQLGAFLCDKGQVKIISVKVNQTAVEFGKIKESLQYIGFLLVAFRHPLYGPPFPGQIVGASDQVQVGRPGGEASGLYVHKKDPLQGCKPFQGIVYRKIIQCFLRNSHGSLQFTIILQRRFRPETRMYAFTVRFDGKIFYHIIS